MAITVLGYGTTSHNVASAQTYNFSSLTDISGSGSVTLQQNDLVVVNYVHSGTATRTLAQCTPTGYSNANATVVTSSDTDVLSMAVTYKFMGATPDTSVSIPACAATTTSCSVNIYVFRGVDSTTPLGGVTPTTATAINGAKPDPASITTPASPTGCVIVGAMGQAQATGAALTAPTTTPYTATSNYFIAANSTAATNDSAAAMAIKTGVAISTAFDASAANGGTTAATDASGSISLVLAPDQYPIIVGSAKSANGSNITHDTNTTPFSGVTCAVGDTLVAIVAIGNNNTITEVNGTWTAGTQQSSSFASSRVFYKIATSTSESLVVKHSGSFDTTLNAYLYRFSGTKTVVQAGTTGTFTVDPPAVTAAALSMVITGGSGSSAPTAAPAGYSGLDSSVPVYVAQKKVASAGSENPGTFTGSVSSWSAHTIGVSADVTAPTITSSSTTSVVENSTLSFALTADEVVTWSITGGADSTKFELSGSTLRWTLNGTKDYEVPNDSDTNNTYVVQVTATDTSGNATNQTITVTVTNDTSDDPPITFVGVSSLVANTGATLSVPVPAGVQSGDLMFLVLENQGAFPTITNWTYLWNYSASASAEQLFVAYRWATSSSEANASVPANTPTYDHQMGTIIAFRGVDPGVTITQAGSNGTTAITSFNFPSVTTTVANSTVLMLCAWDLDSATGQLGTVTNGALTNITTRFNTGDTSGGGGGIGIVTAQMATAGSTGTSAATLNTSTAASYMTIPLTPGSAAAAGNVSVYWF